MKQYDYLVAGGGIAGSVLALMLLKNGRSVMLIDKPSLSFSSRVAGGAWNPFNLRTFTDNWRAEELVAKADTFYKEAEALFGCELYTPRTLLKIFTSADERRLWEKACAEKTQRFARSPLEDPYPGIVPAPYGTGVVSGAGSIDTQRLIGRTAAKLIAQDDFLETHFDHAKLVLTNEGAVYDGKISARQVVFCEGHLARHNPWFGFLPLVPVKGHLIHVRIPGFPLTEILNRGAFLLPLGGDLFALGSTFENNRDDEIPVPEKEAELVSKLEKMVSIYWRLDAVHVGVRPAVKDRRPLLGRHPQHPQLAVFNGMGSKAVLLTPWLAEALVKHIEDDERLPADADLARFVSGAG